MRRSVKLLDLDHSFRFRFASQKRIQRIRQRYPSRLQFGKALPGHPFNQFLPARKQLYQDASPVVPASASAHISARLQPVDQFHCAVVLQQQPLHQCLDGRFRPFREATNRKQQQILLRFEPRAACRGIAFA